MIRDILVNLSTANKNDRARDYALSLAEKFDAHIAGIAFSYDPIYPMAGEVVPAMYLDEQKLENEKAAKSAKANFLKLTGMLRAECHSPSATVFGAANLFAKFGRHFDLNIVEQAGEKTFEYDCIIEAALFESGRPVIVVPYIHSKPVSLNRVLLCWDGSKPSARAISDSLPLLQGVGSIEVITIAERGKVTEDFPGFEIGQHMARHGLKINVKLIDVETINISDAILSYTADMSADLVVMGAYGHSRVREFVLGGVTADILSSMTTPVFMSH